MDSRDFVEARRVWRPLATLVLANSLLLAPVWVLSGGLRPHWLALEAVVVVGAFMLLPDRRWTRGLAGTVGGLLVVVALLELADTTSRMSLARPLNLYLDVRLASAVANLLRGTLGAGVGVLVMVGAALVAVALALLLARLLVRLPDDGASRWWRRVGWALVIVGLVAVPVRWLHPAGVVMGLPGVRVLREQSVQLVRMLREQERFEAEMAAVPARYDDTAGLLAGLGGRDVVMAFIESYGMSALNDPRYASTVRPRLQSMAEGLERADLHVATGALVAPSQGGMSWLGHGSVLSGLWLENQLRYDLLLAGDRRTLVDDFEAAGYRTVALMPAITLAWPEGERFGYDRIYARKDIDYAGPPLNWVTMPDQFTWSFLEHTIRRSSADDGPRGTPDDGPRGTPGDDGRGTPGDDRPLFAELGLISSHAPWTPILPVLDWDVIGDGSVFERWRDAGERPEDLWRDTDRVREHYALAVGYAIDVLASYAARYVEDGTILIALGDHQPAPLVTGDELERTVPVHVIARDPELLEPFLAWGFADGVVPDPSVEAPRMDAFRDWFVTAFSAPRAAGGS